MDSILNVPLIIHLNYQQNLIYLHSSMILLQRRYQRQSMLYFPVIHKDSVVLWFLVQDDNLQFSPQFGRRHKRDMFFNYSRAATSVLQCINVLTVSCCVSPCSLCPAVYICADSVPWGISVRYISRWYGIGRYRLF